MSKNQIKIVSCSSNFPFLPLTILPLPLLSSAVTQALSQIHPNNSLVCVCWLFFVQFEYFLLIICFIIILSSFTNFPLWPLSYLYFDIDLLFFSQSYSCSTEFFYHLQIILSTKNLPLLIFVNFNIFNLISFNLI